ncbi:recombinase family protein [Magnetofaba australis]|uniref:Putative resolvase domain-containing protein n=1 Tax=Magnetofaba australis IT-1 TaxID=1434232 RepID=A0A1Y2K4Z5_9PROT|nr:recombinase family protein [Magnetofaba australis]OSM04450.1 putative resolvase domain-containing protein [Magnetofaba australis IT-1]
MTKTRCAIYTRKSTDEGLDKEFNSLDAQREACEAYIASQKSQGWMLIHDDYDDGGYSGGDMERPGLQRLLKDIENGLVDCVVVYKIDRLSRSLSDFTKMVDLFDAHHVSFVSITQSFNTATSMGRLTLNMLLSFAQYEREITAERIRDKFAASRKKGMWMGGNPPLGYDVRARRLEINPDEAALVRLIFDRFIEIGSSTKLCKELTAAGHTTKSWTAQTGRFNPGKRFDKTALYRILNNRVYLGEVVFKTEVYPGEHEAIITPRQWEQVHAILEQNNRRGKRPIRADSPFPLKGIMQCGHCNRAMTTSHTRKQGKHYRYYVCMTATKHSYGDCDIRNISAGEIEALILAHIEHLVRAPEVVARVWRQTNDGAGPAYSENSIVEVLKAIEPIWAELFPGEQGRLIQLLVRRVTLREDQLQIQLRIEGFEQLIEEFQTQEAA